MGNMGVVLFFGSVVLAIVLGTKLKINFGVFAILFAFILGVTCCGMAPKAVIGNFNITLFFNLFIAGVFYGYATEVGVMQGIAKRIMYLFRKYPWAAPIGLFAASYVVGLCGSDPGSVTIFMSPIAFGVLAEIKGMPELIAPVSIWSGAITGTRGPWASTPLAMQAAFSEGLDPLQVESGLTKAFILVSVIFFLIMFALHVLMGGLKVKGDVIHYEKPEPFNDKQKKVLAVLGLVVGLVILSIILGSFVPSPATKWLKSNFTIQVGASLGIVIYAIMGIEDVNVIIRKRVPMVAITTVCGMAMLMSLADQMGVVDFFAAILTSGVIPTWLILPMLVLVCATLSFFVNGLVVIQLVMSFLPTLVGLAPNITASSLVIASSIGGCCSSISPFSDGGATCLLGCTDDEMRQRLIMKQIAVCAVYIIVVMIAAGVGLFSI